MTMSRVFSIPFKLWIIINLFCFVSSDISSRRFVVHKGLSLSTIASDVTEIASRSVLDCACECKSNNLCHKASYDRMTKRCRIFNDHTGRNCDAGLDVTQTSVFLKTVDEDCTSDWHLFEGNCYFFGVSKVNWTDAQNDCTQRRSCLVTIQNERENKWLVDIIKNSDNNGQHFWIGANDIDIEDDWVWESDKSKLVFSDWNVGQPSSAKEHCVHIRWHKSLYKWNDKSCENDNNLYICEK